MAGQPPPSAFVTLLCRDKSTANNSLENWLTGIYNGRYSAVMLFSSTLVPQGVRPSPFWAAPARTAPSPASPAPLPKPLPPTAPRSPSTRSTPCSTGAARATHRFDRCVLRDDLTPLLDHLYRRKTVVFVLSHVAPAGDHTDVVDRYTGDSNSTVSRFRVSSSRACAHRAQHRHRPAPGPGLGPGTGTYAVGLKRPRPFALHVV